MSSADDMGTPSLSRRTWGTVVLGGLGEGVPGLAVLSASGLPRPWRLQSLRNSAPSARPCPPHPPRAARSGEGASARTWGGGEVT